MAQTIETVCDPHLAKDAKVEGRAVSAAISIKGKVVVSRAIDLCDEDFNRYVQPLLDLLTEHGRRADQPPAASGGGSTTASVAPGKREVCLLCPVERRRELNLPYHARTVHRLTYRELLVLTGQADPSEHICYICEPTRDLGSSQGVASHGRIVHGMDNDVFRKANADANPAVASSSSAKKATPAKKTTATSAK